MKQIKTDMQLKLRLKQKCGCYITVTLHLNLSFIFKYIFLKNRLCNACFRKEMSLIITSINYELERLQIYGSYGQYVHELNHLPSKPNNLVTLLKVLERYSRKK
jgi:hypothetical protein